MTQLASHSIAFGIGLLALAFSSTATAELAAFSIAFQPLGAFRTLK